MPECDYCDRSFDGEGAYLEHLDAEHHGELGRIDRRRVESHVSSDGVGVPPTAVYGVAALVVLAIAGAGMYYVVGAFTGEGQVHEHGTIELVIDGQAVDFNQQQYYTPRTVGAGQAQSFHFHQGQDNIWHLHPNDPGRLTLAEGMDWLGIELTADRLAFEDATYDGTDSGTSVDVRVNGEPTDPVTYELHGTTTVDNAHEGDAIEIHVETDGES